MINRNRLISTFIELVRIDSTSGNENKISKFTTDKLNKLGGMVRKDQYGNIIANFDGIGEPIMLNSHLDTVEPGKNIKPVIEGDKISSDGTTILGADAKSGVASILEGVESVIENQEDHLPIEIVFTVQEEVGLLGAINLEYSYIKSKMGLTLDGVKSIRHITNAAPGYAKVDIAIKGRSAHAGFEPENGVSAVLMAAKIISELKLGRIDYETTANIGLINGGSARNAIPELVKLNGEIRSISQNKLKEHILHFSNTINRTSSDYLDAKIDTNINLEFNPYVYDQSSETIQKTIAILKKLKLDPVIEASGGGSDVNIFKTRGINAICVGAGYYNPHTTREYTLISEMVQGAEFCEEAVKIQV